MQRSDGLKPSDPMLTLGGGGEQTHVVCGQFSFAGVLAPKLLTVLPPLMHIRLQPDRWLRLKSHFMIEETRHHRPGSAITIAKLLDFLFIQTIREWGAKNPRNVGRDGKPRPVGWDRADIASRHTAPRIT